MSALSVMSFMAIMNIFFRSAMMFQVGYYFISGPGLPPVTLPRIRKNREKKRKYSNTIRLKVTYTEMTKSLPHDARAFCSKSDMQYQFLVSVFEPHHGS